MRTGWLSNDGRLTLKGHNSGETEDKIGRMLDHIREQCVSSDCSLFQAFFSHASQGIVYILGFDVTALLSSCP